MIHNNKVATIQSKEATALQMFTFILFFVLCSTGVFAQQRNIIEVPASINDNKVAATDAQMDLLFWVLGSRQGRVSIDAVQKSMSHKKQMINSGMAPNRILSRTFMNKAINYDSTLT